MGLRAPRPGCVQTLQRWLVAASFACGAPETDADRDAAQLGAPQGASLTGSELAASPEPAELSEPTEPSDLLLALGGQTGSEGQTTPGEIPCAPIHSVYELSGVTPLGFAAAELTSALGQGAYWATGLGSTDGAVELMMQLSSSATFIDRDPSVSPDFACLDVVRVASHFTVSDGVQTLAELDIELYADALRRFAGFVWLGPESLQGALAEAAGDSEVIVNVESTGDGLRFWFSRVVDTRRELFGRIVPVP